MINFMLLQTGYYFSLCSLSQPQGITLSSPLKPVPNKQGNLFSECTSMKVSQVITNHFILLGFWNNVKRDTDQTFFFPKKLGYIIKQFYHVYLIVFHEQQSQYHSQTNNHRILHSCHSCIVYKYDGSFHFSEQRIHLFT